MTPAGATTQLIEAARRESFVDPAGRPIKLSFEDGLDESQIADIEATAPAVLPAELREALRCASGFTFFGEDISITVDLTGRMERVLERVFPRGHVIAADGFGNFWFIDLDGTAEPPTVYFVCHDPPVVAIQAHGMAAFLEELFNLGRPKRTSALDAVVEAGVTRIWRDNPGLIPVASARAHGDDVLRVFAEGLDPTYDLADLRDAAIGAGFSWGRAGPNTTVIRFDTHPIFALEPRRPGLMKRLFGR